MEQELVLHGVYRHFKSRNSADERYGVYKVLGTALDSETKEDVLKKSIDAVKKDYPDFAPQFDEHFFRLKLKK